MFKGYRTSPTADQQQTAAFIPTNLGVGMQLLVHAKINRWPSAITL